MLKNEEYSDFFFPVVSVLAPCWWHFEISVASAGAASPKLGFFGVFL